jgi:biotin synthase
MIATPSVAEDWCDIAEQVLAGQPIDRQQALAILRSDDDDILALLDGAYRLRLHYFGKRMKLNMLINAKSGLCPEDCHYCSQRLGAKTDIGRYPLVDRETLVAGAKEAQERCAGTYCIVSSGRGPTNKEVDHIVDAIKEIKSTTKLKICACLGILKEGQAERLMDAGVDRYNHNINSNSRFFPEITGTHGYDDRVRTVEKAKAAGISPCSGVIVGMGETDEDVVDMAFSLRELDADSIPINFLVPIAGTPLAKQTLLSPMYCLKVLALFRFVCPSKEIRASGGREVQLRSLQSMALFAANSIFLGDYLTTDGQDAKADHEMIADLGFEIET